MASTANQPDVDREYEKYKPEDTDFRQQRLRAWQPLLIPKWIILTFLVLGTIFLPLGFAIRSSSQGIVELEERYDHLSCSDGSNNPECGKTVDFVVPDRMDGPVFFYYKLTNFYQNHRRYVKSRSDAQLAGKTGSTTSCEPLEREGNDGPIYYPCGLIANSFFDDEFSPQWHSASETDFKQLTTWSEDNIAWSTDRDIKFKEKYGPGNLPDTLTRMSHRGKELPYLNDEHLMVWFRPAAWPTFRKLYAIIDQTFEKGDVIRINVVDRFPSKDFSGEKRIILTTVKWIGGKNLFLAYAYIASGAFCYLFALIFLAKQLIAPRELGNMKSVSGFQRFSRSGAMTDQ